ncbi:hypothetical protein STCU_05848 [Strigomonas culicis]|uniref:Uncharacterized protein n=1 Tax=Strigomonas culicis TaxID=28005 RepID=S9UEU5_9TRYP|nr:hypothetical protein STCU_05848 [Strigomonas culicis]|eukprot:EPY27244.1 hypothetical protein STCU_05848 [Strigomonas culicis]
MASSHLGAAAEAAAAAVRTPLSSAVAPAGGSASHPNVMYYHTWVGEWPYVKRGIKEVRMTLQQWCSSVTTNEFFDTAQFLKAAKQMTSETDARWTRQGLLLHRYLRERPWVLPAAGIAGLSAFVFVKSARWGNYYALRNSVAALVLSTCFVFPRELLLLADDHLPFSVRELRAANTEAMQQQKQTPLQRKLKE